MAKLREPESVKILFGLLYPDIERLKRIESAIEERWGPIDLRSDPLPFHYTKYYAEEMGGELLRSWCTVRDLVTPDGLADWKIETNALEMAWARGENRTVNIDPGYISLSKIVLGSAKNFSHRIYLSQGIYAEITLVYQGKTFHAHPWTFPDYKDAIPLFNQWRETLRSQQKLAF